MSYLSSNYTSNYGMDRSHRPSYYSSSLLRGSQPLMEPKTEYDFEEHFRHLPPTLYNRYLNSHKFLTRGKRLVPCPMSTSGSWQGGSYTLPSRPMRCPSIKSRPTSPIGYERPYTSPSRYQSSVRTPSIGSYLGSLSSNVGVNTSKASVSKEHSPYLVSKKKEPEEESITHLLDQCIQSVFEDLQKVTGQSELGEEIQKNVDKLKDLVRKLSDKKRSKTSSLSKKDLEDQLSEKECQTNKDNSLKQEDHSKIPSKQDLNGENSIELNENKANNECNELNRFNVLEEDDNPYQIPSKMKKEFKNNDLKLNEEQKLITEIVNQFPLKTEQTVSTSEEEKHSYSDDNLKKSPDNLDLKIVDIVQQPVADSFSPEPVTNVPQQQIMDKIEEDFNPYQIPHKTKDKQLEKNVIYEPIYQTAIMTQETFFTNSDDLIQDEEIVKDNLNPYQIPHKLIKPQTENLISQEISETIHQPPIITQETISLEFNKSFDKEYLNPYEIPHKSQEAENLKVEENVISEIVYQSSNITQETFASLHLEECLSEKDFNDKEVNSYQNEMKEISEIPLESFLVKNVEKNHKVSSKLIRKDKDLERRCRKRSPRNLRKKVKHAGDINKLIDLVIYNQLMDQLNEFCETSPELIPSIAAQDQTTFLRDLRDKFSNKLNIIHYKIYQKVYEQQQKERLTPTMKKYHVRPLQKQVKNQSKYTLLLDLMDSSSFQRFLLDKVNYFMRKVKSEKVRKAVQSHRVISSTTQSSIDDPSSQLLPEKYESLALSCPIEQQHSSNASINDSFGIFKRFCILLVLSMFVIAIRSINDRPVPIQKAPVIAAPVTPGAQTSESVLTNTRKPSDISCVTWILMEAEQLMHFGEE